jgi:hypothetical protein
MSPLIQGKPDSASNFRAASIQLIRDDIFVPILLGFWRREGKLHYEQCHPLDGQEWINFWHRSFTFKSNKSLTWCKKFSVYYPDVCLQLNRFRAFSHVVGPGPTTNTARLSPRYEGKTRCCHCSHWAPNDGRENARKMLSCKQTSG